jgi:hypothetical protein
VIGTPSWKFKSKHSRKENLETKSLYKYKSLIKILNLLTNLSEEKNRRSCSESHGDSERSEAGGPLCLVGASQDSWKIDEDCPSLELCRHEPLLRLKDARMSRGLRYSADSIWWGGQGEGWGILMGLSTGREWEKREGF